MVMIVLTGLVSARLTGDAEGRPAAQPTEADDISRDKALAAAIAVSALVASPHRGQSPGGDRG